jgi:hypothetical protein
MRVLQVNPKHFTSLSRHIVRLKPAAVPAHQPPIATIGALPATRNPRRRDWTAMTETSLDFVATRRNRDGIARRPDAEDASIRG